MPEFAGYTLPRSPLHQPYELFERQGNEVPGMANPHQPGPGWCGLAMPGTSPFMASMAPTGHAKNAGSAAKSCTGCLIPTWRAI